MNISNKITSILLAALSLLLYSCNTTEPGDSAELKLTVEDISCTEAWIRLTASGISSPSVIEIKADDKLLKQVSAAGTSIDSIIYIDSFLPGKEYRFAASIGKGNASEATARTLDTTSHDFVWKTFQFGDHGSSLYDVAILDNSEIWAVGEIYLNGETDAYNAVHWDGEKWEVKHISVNYNNNIIIPPLYSVSSTGYKEIFLSAGVPIFGDGTNWKQYHLFDMGILNNEDGHLTTIWGNSSSDLFYVGTKGTIVHYNGQSWKKIESGTQTNILDITGVEDIYGVTAVYCTVSNPFEDGDRKILRIKDNKVDSVLWNIGGILHGIWTNSERYLFVTGWGIYSSRKGFWTEETETMVTTNGIIGTDINNIFVCGDFGFISHYNGYTWKIYNEVFNAGYGRVDVKENIVAISGQQDGKGIITIGKRN